MFENKFEKKILFLGPEGTYTSLARDKFIEKYSFENAHSLPQNAIITALQEIDQNTDKDLLAVIPIENSIEGVVRETLDNLTRINDKSVKILAEIAIPISHCLITKAKKIEDIVSISSYPQGIAQCREFIQTNLRDDIVIKTAQSTAMAVRDLIDTDETQAAIASENAAELYHLPILMREINDEKDNKTRFILIGREDTPRTGNDKTSITFTTENKPGALNKVLNILDKYQINMSYIDSRPSRKFLGEYTFYIDFDGHIKDEKIAKALFEILQYTKLFKHLGSYEKY